MEPRPPLPSVGLFAEAFPHTLVWMNVTKFLIACHVQEPPPGPHQGDGIPTYQYHDPNINYGPPPPPAPEGYPHPQPGAWGSTITAPGTGYGDQNAGYQHTGSYAAPPGYEQGAAYSGYHPPTGSYGQYGSARASYHQYAGGYATHG